MTVRLSVPWQKRKGRWSWGKAKAKAKQKEKERQYAAELEKEAAAVKTAEYGKKQAATQAAYQAKAIATLSGIESSNTVPEWSPRNSDNYQTIKKVSPEEAKGINMDNISSLMPDQNYYDKDTGIRLTTFSKRNIKKELKSLVSKGVDINTITWENFNGR